MTVEILRIGDTTTRVELEAMLTRLRVAQRTAPACMGERFSQRMDVLLDAWGEADDGRL